MCLQNPQLKKKKNSEDENTVLNYTEQPGIFVAAMAVRK